jgi:DNA ligase 1
VFDILFLNNQSLIFQQLSERRKILKSNIIEEKGKLQFVTYIDLANVDDMQAFLNQSIKDSCEGLMVKTLENNSTYEPAKRSFKWLK